MIVLDSGGGNIRIGSAEADQPQKAFPNATARIKGEKASATADQISALGDVSAITLKRPVDRGYVLNWDLQRLIWDRAFKTVSESSDKFAHLVATEPLFSLENAQQERDQIVFENFGFGSFLPLPAPLLSLRSFAHQQPAKPANQALCGIVVDCGYSFTHAVPILGGCILNEGVRRINLGGKALTNYLKELVSFRSINMMEETYIVEHIKEVSCFVSQNLKKDLAAAKAGSLNRLYVLPDGVSCSRGYLRQPFTSKELEGEAAKKAKESPAIALSNERFMVPEIIFHPMDLGMPQAGLAQAVVEAANATHPELRPLLFSNVICTGGTALCPGFAERLYSELRPLLPAEYELSVNLPENPATAAWQGGALFGRSAEYRSLACTKAEFEERGSANMRDTLYKRHRGISPGL